MLVKVSKAAKKDIKSLTKSQQRKVAKQLEFLRNNLRHPSLNAKKYPEGGEDVWQARVDRSHRFYFTIELDAYIILRVTPHPK